MMPWVKCLTGKKNFYYSLCDFYFVFVWLNMKSISICGCLYVCMCVQLHIKGYLWTIQIDTANAGTMENAMNYIELDTNNDNKNGHRTQNNRHF